MRNRAKCRQCQDIIESYHRHDYVTCKCGKISIDGGNDFFRVVAEDFNDVIRIDDEGNEIIVTVKDNHESQQLENPAPNLTRKDLIDQLDLMRQEIERIPAHAMLNPITHTDYCALLLLLSAIFREDS